MREVYRKTLLLLAANPRHPSLRLLSLRGRLQGLHSVSINLSYRITLEVLIEGQTLIPIDIGFHDLMYRS
jgi:plasmid maintenance system killer protein